MSKWQGLPKDITQYYGFVYQITNLATGRKYIGKKSFWRRVTRKPLKGRKNKRRSWVESDWNNYWGSNKELLQDIKSLGVKNFKREILILCKHRWETSYYEAKMQFETDALLKPEYYNGILNCRIGGLKKNVEETEEDK